MSPERWQRVEDVYHSALEREPGDRPRFLEEACRGDPELQSEVESLLAQETSKSAGLIDRPVWEIPTNLLNNGTLTQLLPGNEIGPYRIEALLGAGGMGVVYRARDSKLNRTVAIKLLSDDLSDAAARRRFQREAQMASSLNHPHILTVHDAGEFDGRQYLVTEYVDGTFEDWVRSAKSTWHQIVQLLLGIADGGRRASGRHPASRYQARQHSRSEEPLRQAGGLRTRQTDRFRKGKKRL